MSMITNVYYVPTLLGALSNTYSAGSYVRTLGFAEAGDGGAAMYEISSETVSGASSYTIAGTPFNYGGGKFYTSSSAVFQLLPSNGKVYAEQFGVLPCATTYSSNNSAMFRLAVAYSASNGYRLEFGSKSTYYFSGGVTLVNNLHIDGCGATLEFFGNSDGYTFFHLAGLAKNVSFQNVAFAGRRTAANSYGDQFMWSRVENLTMKNVRLKNFAYGLRTYTIDIAKDYDNPPIENKNWLIEDCSITDTVIGLQLSEIDGITIRNSRITSIYPTEFPVGTYGSHSYYDANVYPEAHIYDDLGGLHNIYIEANCINVRLSNLIMGNVTGDAVHKAYAVTSEEAEIRFDKSKNHFYTDLSINKCNAPLNIGFISENVMCDNVFGTDLRYLVHLSAASNCIVANSSLTVERKTFERPNAQNPKQIDTVNPNLGLYVHSACSCWFQDSYLKTNGRQRVCSNATEDAYYHEMSIKPNDSTDDNFVDKRHMRTFIDTEFDIPNHWFKFTGCKLEVVCDQQYYFADAFNLSKAVFSEYWDNCISVFSEDSLSDFSRLKCINSLSAGITIRNSYLKNTNSGSASPFRFHCGTGNCNCIAEDVCPKKQLGKRFPFVHYENNILDNFLYANASTGWNYHINTYHGEDHNFTISEAVDISGSYVSNVYRLNNGKFSQMSNLM